MKIAADAAAVCGKDLCGKVWHGEAAAALAASRRL